MMKKKMSGEKGKEKEGKKGKKKAGKVKAVCLSACLPKIPDLNSRV